MPPSHVFPEWRYNTLLGSIKYQVITHTKNPHQTSMLLPALIRCRRKIRLQQSTFFWIYITLNNSGCFDWHKAFRDGFASSLVPFPLINIYKQFSVLCVLCCFFFLKWIPNIHTYLGWRLLIFINNQFLLNMFAFHSTWKVVLSTEQHRTGVPIARHRLYHRAALPAGPTFPHCAAKN